MFLNKEKLALFIDGANLFATAKSLGFDIDYKRLLREFQSRGDLLRAFYYTAVIEDQEFSSIRPLIDWLDYNGYTVVTKPTKEFVDQTGSSTSSSCSPRSAAIRPRARPAEPASRGICRNSCSAVQPRRALVPTKKSSRAKFRVARMPRDSHRVASCPAASLHKDAPIPRTIQTVGRTLAMPVLGGLHHHYFRA